MGRSRHCSSSSSCLSRCQELWVDASSQHLVQGDILTGALSSAPSHSSNERQDRRRRFTFPKPVCLQDRHLQPRLPLDLSGYLPDERNGRAWGLVLPFLKGMDRTNCIPAAPVSLYWLYRDQIRHRHPLLLCGYQLLIP